MKVAPPLHLYLFANHFREELEMTYQEKKFRDKADKQNQKGSKEDANQFRQEAGSRVSEAEESGNLKSPRDDDSETLDDEDEDDVY